MTKPIRHQRKRPVYVTIGDSRTGKAVAKIFQKYRLVNYECYRFENTKGVEAWKKTNQRLKRS